MADETKQIIIGVGLDTSEVQSGVDEVKSSLGKINNTQLDKPFKSFKAEIKEAINEAKRLEDQFGSNSKEFANAAKRVAELKDRFGEFNQSIAGFNPDNKLQALVSAARGATGAIQGVTGAMSFLGVESGSAEETIKRLQGLMAFSEALNSVDDIKNAYKNFGLVIQNTSLFQKGLAAANTVTSVSMKALGFSVEGTSVGFKVLRGAIVATGIGALVIGLIALIQNFDQVKKYILNLIPGLGSVASFIGKVVNSITDFIGVTSEAERATKKLIESTEEQIKKTEEFLDANGYKYDEFTNRKIKANLDYQKHLVEVNKDEAKSEEEKQALLKQYRDKADFEINKAADDRNKKIQDDNKKAADEAKKKHDEEVSKAKELADKKKAIADKARDEENKRQANITEQDKRTSKLILDARLAAINDEFTQKQLKLAISEQDEIDAENDLLNRKLISNEEYQIRKKAIDDRYQIEQGKLLIDKSKQDAENAIKAQEEVRNNLLSGLTDKKTTSESEVVKTERLNTVTDSDSPDVAKQKVQKVLQAKLAAENAAYELEKDSKAGNAAELELLWQQHQSRIVSINKEASDANKAIDDKAAEAKKISLQVVGNALGSFAELVGRQTVAGKAFAIAQTTIDTYQSATSAYKSLSGIPVVGPALGAVAAAAAVASGIANVKKILSVQVPGKGSGGGSVPTPPANAAPVINAQATTQQQIQDVRVTNNQQGNQPIKAYITNSDLETNEQKQKFLNAISTF